MFASTQTTCYGMLTLHNCTRSITDSSSTIFVFANVIIKPLDRPDLHGFTITSRRWIQLYHWNLEI